MDQGKEAFIRASVAQYLGACALPESPESLAAKLHKVQNVARLLGMENKIKNMNLDDTVSAIENRIDSLILSSRPIINPETHTTAELARHFKERQSALQYLHRLGQITGFGKSIVDSLGFKQHLNGEIEITLPAGQTVEGMGGMLNAEFRSRYSGWARNIFPENDFFWLENESRTDLRMEPGVTYRFRVIQESIFGPRWDQRWEGYEFAPLGAVALAEACARLESGGGSGLSPHLRVIRGATPDAALDLVLGLLRMQEGSQMNSFGSGCALRTDTGLMVRHWAGMI